MTNSLKLKLNWSLSSLPNELKLNGYRLFYQHNGTNDTIESNGRGFKFSIMTIYRAILSIFKVMRMKQK